jgi:hypothetical protein
MSFADIPDEVQGDFKPIHFVKIQSGIPLRLRVLDKKAYHSRKHFIPSQRVSIVCPGEEECPICQNNQKLIRENPDANVRSLKGFISRQNRYLANVLNRSLVKVSSAGNVIYQAGGQFPTHDPSTGELLVDIEAQPLNRVEVLERGPTLFTQLNTISQTVIDDAGNPVGLTNFDIVIMASGQGRKMTTNIVPYPNQNDEVNVPEEDLYDLEDVGIRLRGNEIIELLKGVSLRDIFEARRAEEAEELAEELSGVEGEIADEVKDSIESLFPN